MWKMCEKNNNNTNDNDYDNNNKLVQRWWIRDY